MFKSISGFNKIDSGTIRFKDRDITKLGPVEVCRAGIACTFQKAQSFAGMTLEESVLGGRLPAPQAQEGRAAVCP